MFLLVLTIKISLQKKNVELIFCIFYLRRDLREILVCKEYEDRKENVVRQEIVDHQVNQVLRARVLLDQQVNLIQV